MSEREMESPIYGGIERDEESNPERQRGERDRGKPVQRDGIKPD